MDTSPPRRVPVSADTGAGLSAVAQPGPYYVQASCELSEDHFLTDSVIVADGDKIMPFSVVDPFTGAVTVEALVLSSGQLSHLYPDPAATSGWSYTVVREPSFDYVSDAAVVGGGFGGQLMVTGSRSLPAPPGATTAAAWLTRVGPGDWSVGQTGTVPERIGPLSAGVSQDGPYWYGWVPSEAGTTDQFSLLVYDARNVGTEMLTQQYPKDMQLTIAETVVLFDPGQVTNGTPTGFAVVLTSDKQISTFNQTGPASFSGQATSLLPTDAAALLWAYSTPGSATGQPAILWQNENGIVGFQDETGALNFTDFTYGNPAGDGQVAAWKLNGAYTFTFLDDGLAQVVSQIPGTGSGISWTAPIPLAGGFEKIYSLPSDPAESTLFAVDLDQTLNVLTKDPVTGWTQNVVHQDGASLQSVTSWQAQITAFDASGVGVGAGQIRLGTDRPVGFWQATGSTIILPDAPVTMTADGGGKLTVSIPAAELDTAILTAQALDSSGNPSGSPFTITPDTDVQRFLAGQGSLTGTGKLTGAALLAAQSDGKDVFPVLTGLPSSQQGSGAGAVAAAVAHVTTLGLQPGVAGAAQSAVFDLTGATPTFQTSASPEGLTAGPGALGSLDWWDTVKHDAESAFHGLRHGALKFKKMVSSWDADLHQWTLNLVLDIGSGIDQVMDYVVSDVRSAIHAVSGFFQALGADLRTAWDWLKHNVLELIKEADANAAVIEGFLGQLTGQLHTQMTKIGVAKAGFFSSLETRAHQEISKLAQAVEQDTFGSAAPLPPPTDDTGSSDADLLFKDAEDAIKFMRHCSGQWLLNKLIAHLPSVPSDGGPTLDPSVGQVLSDVITDFEASISVIEDIFNTIQASAKMMDSASGFSQANMGTLFTDLDQTVHDSLQLLDKIAQTLIDLLNAAIASIEDLLGYQYQAVPLIGDLLELAGIDTTLSIKHLVSLVIAYPTTLIHNLAVGGTLFPSSTAQAHKPLGSAVPDPWGAAINWPSGVTQFTWAFNDGYLDCIAMGNFSKGTNDPAPSFTTYVDIVCPLILGILQWPSAPVNNLTQPPFSGYPLSDSEAQALCPFIISTGFAPALVGIFALGVTKDQDPDGKFDTYVQPWVQTVSGLANCVLGAVLAWHEASSSWDKSEGILGNISYIIAPTGSQYLADATEGISLLVKAVVDALGNFGAGLPMFNDALTASGT
jgi:hypothetical protein